MSNDISELKVIPVTENENNIEVTGKLLGKLGYFKT